LASSNDIKRVIHAFILSSLISIPVGIGTALGSFFIHLAYYESIDWYVMFWGLGIASFGMVALYLFFITGDDKDTEKVS
jgi:hypothetical protein